MSQISHMLGFLNRVHTAEGEERQQLVEKNKALLRTDLAQQAAQQRIELYERHVRRLERGLKLVRAEQETAAADSAAEGAEDPGGEG